MASLKTWASEKKKNQAETHEIQLQWNLYLADTLY